MKKKILKYLSSKESQSFSHLDNILKMYLDGVLNELLLKYGYTDIEIFPAINKNSKAIQVNFKYHNIVTTIDFMEDEYSYVTYSTGTKIEKLEKLFVDCSYSDDFEFEALIKELDSKIKKHKERKDNTLDKKRKKKYSIIATMCMSFSIITISVIALYVIITDSEIQLNFWWFIVLVIIPLILWSIFDMKSNK